MKLLCSAGEIPHVGVLPPLLRIGLVLSLLFPLLHTQRKIFEIIFLQDNQRLQQAVEPCPWTLSNYTAFIPSNLDISEGTGRNFIMVFLFQKNKSVATGSDLLISVFLAIRASGFLTYVAIFFLFSFIFQTDINLALTEKTGEWN